MRYRVEIEERRTTTRWAYVDAFSPDEARGIVEDMDWHTLEEAGTDTHNEITNVEEILS